MAINNVFYNRAALTATKGMSAGSVPRAMQGGIVRTQIEHLILDGTGTTANLGPTLPKDAVVVGIGISAAALTGTLTMSVGDTNTAALYITTEVADANNLYYPVQAPTYTQGLSADDYSPIVTKGLGYVIGSNDDDDQLIATMSAAGGAGEKLSVTIHYVV